MTDRSDGAGDFEDQWAQIVADLTSGPDAVVADESPDVPEDRGASTPSGSTESLAALFEPLRRAEPVPDASFVDGWADEGHYTPPPPPEIPEGTPLTRLAWVGTLGGPATLIAVALTGWDAPLYVTVGAGLAFLAGFLTLVWRMPESREDGWDDGARL